MDYIITGFIQAFRLLLSGDAQTYSAISVTVRLTCMSMAASLIPHLVFTPVAAGCLPTRMARRAGMRHLVAPQELSNVSWTHRTVHKVITSRHSTASQALLGRVVCSPSDP